MGSIELFVYSAAIAFFSLTFFLSFFSQVFSAGKMRIIFLFFYLSYIILESNSIHGKTVSGVRERDSDASSAVRNRRAPKTWTKIGKEIGKEIMKWLAMEVGEKLTKKVLGKGSEKKKPELEDQEKPSEGDQVQEWMKEMNEKMDPHMELKNFSRIMRNRLDQKKCAKSKYVGQGVCIDGNIVGCFISKNLYYYCWHTCGDSWCWTKRFEKDLRCNTLTDCVGDAFLNNEYEISKVTKEIFNITESVSDLKPRFSE